MKVYSFFKSSAKGIRLFAVITAATMVGGLSTAMVMAAIPHSTTGVISGCYNSSGGLRVINVEASEACGGTETPISWSSTITLSRRASFEPTDPVTTLLAIPGYGELEVDPSQCNADNMTQAPIDYKNTTGTTLVLAGPESGNLNPVNPNDSYRIGTQTSGYGNEQYFLSTASNSNKVVNIRLTGYGPANANDTACTYYAHVTYQP